MSSSALLQALALECTSTATAAAAVGDNPVMVILRMIKAHMADRRQRPRHVKAILRAPTV